MEKTRPAVAGLENGVKVTQAKDCKQLPEAGKGKEIEVSRKACNPANTLILTQ